MAMTHRLVVPFFLLAFTLAHGQSSSATASGSWDPNSAAFDVASIRESGGGNLSFIDNPHHASFLLAQRMTVEGLIINAYHVHGYYLLDVKPSWARETRYDIQAKSDEELDRRLAALPDREAASVKDVMLRRLLANRFKLKMHQQTTIGVVYELVTMSQTTTLFHSASPPAKPVVPEAEEFPTSCGDIRYSRAGSELIATHCSMKSLLSYLKMAMATDVVDHTGLTGYHAFDLKSRDAVSHLSNDETFYTPMIQSVSDQLGLKLRRTKGPVTKWVVDQVERPTPN